MDWYFSGILWKKYGFQLSNFMWVVGRLARFPPSKARWAAPSQPTACSGSTSSLRWERKVLRWHSAVSASYCICSSSRCMPFVECLTIGCLKCPKTGPFRGVVACVERRLDARPHPFHHVLLRTCWPRWRPIVGHGCPFVPGHPNCSPFGEAALLVWNVPAGKKLTSFWPAPGILHQKQPSHKGAVIRCDAAHPLRSPPQLPRGRKLRKFSNQREHAAGG